MKGKSNMDGTGGMELAVGEHRAHPQGSVLGFRVLFAETSLLKGYTGYIVGVLYRDTGEMETTILL